MIEINGLHKSYGDKHILRGVDFRIGKGETMILIGPSGSGKSSLIRCIGALESFTQGSIRIGTDLIPNGNGTLSAREKEQLRKLRQRVGMVFQQFNLFPHMSVLENIIEAPLQVLKLSRDEAIERAHGVLQKVGLKSFADRKPASLSGGEQQRVAIARTLAMRPECILFDEPTSSLDPETVGDVLQVMRDLADEGMTMLAATHEMTFAREAATQVIMLDGGHIIESGSPNKIFHSPEHERTRSFLKRVLAR